MSRWNLIYLVFDTHNKTRLDKVSIDIFVDEDDKGIYVFLQTKKKIKSESCSIFSGETKKLQLFFLSHWH